MTFRLVQASIEGLEAIDDYTVRAWDAAQADRYLAMQWETFESIAADPARWRLGRQACHPVPREERPSGDHPCAA